jgi:AmiR/NasT family two-component response regulator
MAQSLASRRALIVDDEFLIAFDLEASMRELGFDLLGFIEQVVGQRSRRATLDLFDDRGRGSAVYVYPWRFR